MKNKIFLISGPSGVGKKTIIDNFINDKDLNLSYSISMTTRPKREHEVDKKDYYFVSNEEFNEAINNNEMLEWAEFCNNKYGTRKSEINRIISENKSVLLEIEIQGALKVFEMYKPDEFVSIFLVPPSIEELKKRLINRGTESIEQINNRVLTAKKELQYQDRYKYVVVNDDLESATKNIVEIIKREQNE